MNRTFAVGDKVAFHGQFPWRTYYGRVAAVVDDRTVRVRWDDDGATSEVGTWNNRLQHHNVADSGSDQ
jgi:hypothetical protein